MWTRRIARPGLPGGHVAKHSRSGTEARTCSDLRMSLNAHLTTDDAAVADPRTPGDPSLGGWDYQI